LQSAGRPARRRVRPARPSSSPSRGGSLCRCPTRCRRQARPATVRHVGYSIIRNSRRLRAPQRTQWRPVQNAGNRSSKRPNSGAVEKEMQVAEGKRQQGRCACAQRRHGGIAPNNVRRLSPNAGASVPAHTSSDGRYNVQRQTPQTLNWAGTACFSVTQSECLSSRRMGTEEIGP